MRIAHYGHSCVLLSTGSARLLFDPGAYSTGFETITELDAVLITHQHPDHLDRDRLPALLAANPRAALVSDEDSAADLEELGLKPTSVARPGDTLAFGDTSVSVVGGRHETIHEDLPMPANVGYVVDHGAFYHPGDALFVPDQRIDVLGLPMSAPWLKTGEMIDFLRAVHPRVAVPIHEALLSDLGFHSQLNWISRLVPDTDVRPLTAEPTSI